MNKLFLAFIFAFVHGCGCIGIAQTTPNTQTYFQNLPTPVNLIKNPDARLNALDVQKTGTVVVTATAATGNSPSYFSLGAISTLGYAEFDLRPVKSDMTSGQCEFKGKYFGTEASKYSARIFNGTTEIIKVVLQNTTSDLSNGGPWKEFSVGAPCSSNPKVRIYADAVGLSLNVNRLYYGSATNIGNVSQAYKIGSISVTGCSWSSAVPQITAANFPVTTGCTYSTTGEVLAPSTMIPGFRLNSIKPGAYQIIGTGSFVKTVTANGGSALFRFSDGSIYSAISQSGLSANSDLATPSINGSFEYSSPLGQTTIQVQGWANNSLIGAAINGGFRFDVYYFPSASELVVRADSLDYAPRPYTPTITGFGTPTNVDCTEARRGYENIIECKFVSGTTTSVEARVSLPYSRVTTAFSGGGTKSLGVYFRGNAALPNNYGGGVLYESSTGYLTFAASNILTNAAGNWNTLGKAVATAMVGAGDIVSFKVAVPIEGWNSNANGVMVIPTNDLTPVDAFLSSQSTTAGTLQKLNIVATVNSNGLFSGGTFTSKDKCNYLVNAGADIGPFSTGPGAFVQTVLAIYKNGAEFRRRNGTSSSVPSPISLSAIVPLNSGETLELYGNPGTGNGNGMGNISMQVIKLPNCN